MVTSEWIVFGLSIASLAIIVFYVLYEVLQPLFNRQKYRQQTYLEYVRRYNREEYERIKPKDVAPAPQSQA
jgi:hypothetical protein